jgi:small GTP-binding protein
MVRFRTLGCYPLTGASALDTLPPSLRGDAELEIATVSERQGRAIDRDQSPRWKRKSRKAISDEFSITFDKTAAEIESPLPTRPPPCPRKTVARQARPLRFITCGSVDDGKSTLIGRLLYDTKMIFEDQRPRSGATPPESGNSSARRSTSRCSSTVCRPSANRASPSMSPTAFRHRPRKFIVADTPGHEQYTRNMATGASTADLAVLLIDARAGILEQTRRHATIAALMGIRQFVLAVNKIELQGDRPVAGRAPGHRHPGVGAQGREHRHARRRGNALV